MGRECRAVKSLLALQDLWPWSWCRDVRSSARILPLELDAWPFFLQLAATSYQPQSLELKSARSIKSTGAPQHPAV